MGLAPRPRFPVSVITGFKMKKDKYTEEQVVDQLKRQGIKISQKTADATKMAIVGIKTLGKLDFLQNYCKYTVYLPKDN